MCCAPPRPSPHSSTWAPAASACRPGSGGPACALAASLGLELDLTDAARIGLTVCGAAGPPERALAGSATGAVMRRVESEADIAFCARLDTTTVVPAVAGSNGTEPYPVILL